jgi:hypothetical protein
MAERPIPELPMPVPDTRHLALCLSLYSILHTRYSRIFWSTEPLSLRASSVRPLSTCHRAHVPPGLSHQPNQYFHTITIAAVSSSQ